MLEVLEKSKTKYHNLIKCDFCCRLISIEEAEEISENNHHRLDHGYCSCGNHLFSGNTVFGGSLVPVEVNHEQ